jgi:hypothetical protein
MRHRSRLVLLTMPLLSTVAAPVRAQDPVQCAMPGDEERRAPVLAGQGLPTDAA